MTVACVLGSASVHASNSKTLTRDIEEVVVVATDEVFGDFLNLATDRIHLYRYDPADPNRFVPIPFQIDRKRTWDLTANCSVLSSVCTIHGFEPPPPNCETNYDFDANGDPVAGNLGKGDEIVFLAADTGPRAPDTVEWHPGVGVSATRYEIQVNDFLTSPYPPGKGWVYAYLFPTAHAFELDDPYYVQWRADLGPDDSRPTQTCTSGDPNTARGQKSCGWFEKGPKFDWMFDKPTHQLRYLGHWVINRKKVVGVDATLPAENEGDLIDRIKWRAGGETEWTWSSCGCAKFLGLKIGPVRGIFLAQGSASGFNTTRVDWLYGTHYRSMVRLRVHPGVSNIRHFTDYMNAVSPSDLYTQSNLATKGDTIDGQPPATSFGFWQDWTQVNVSLGGSGVGRLVDFFKETRPLDAGTPDYYYQDSLSVNLIPQFQLGAYGNHGEKWPGPTGNSQPETCDLLNPDNPRLPWRQFDFSSFVTTYSSSSPNLTPLPFANWMRVPLRHRVRKEMQGVPRPPDPPGPTCPTRLDSGNPQNGRDLNVTPDKLDPACTDSTVGFVVYRAVGQGAFTYLAEVGIGETFQDFQVFRGQTYRYQALAQNADGTEGMASPIVTMTAVDTVPPAVPLNVIATAWDSAISLSWDQGTDWDIHGYNLFLSTTPGGPYTKANPTLITVPSRTFTASGLQNGTPYYAVVRAVDRGANESANSAEVSAVPGP